MIKRIRVQGYKSLYDVDVELAPLTVIFGPNAAGKSNLLDALSLLSRMVSRENLDAAFSDHRGSPLEAFSLGHEGMAGIQERDSATFSMSVDLELSEGAVAATEAAVRQAREGLPSSTGSRRSVIERRLRYSVSVEVITRTGHLRVVDEKLEALKSDWSPKESRRPFLEVFPKKGRIHLRMEKQAHPIYEDIGQDRTIASKPLYPPHHPHIAAFREELSRWRFYFLQPPAMREEVALKEVETLAWDGSDLAAFYNTLQAVNPRQFQALGKALSRVVPTIESVEVVRTPQGLVRLEIDEGGLRLPSRLTSEGTLRVLGLLAITNPLRPSSFIGYEEPENGIHPARLKLVADLLTNSANRGTAQFLVNTHSPVLPEYFMDVEGASLIHCRRSRRQTVFESFMTSGPLLAESEIEAALDEGSTRFRDKVVRGDLL